MVLRGVMGAVSRQARDTHFCDQIRDLDKNRNGCGHFVTEASRRGRHRRPCSKYKALVVERRAYGVA